MTEHEEDDEEYQWGPGDILPEHDRIENMYGEVRDLFQKMEDKIDSAFLDVNSKLENVEARVALLEQNSSTLSTSVSSKSSSDGKRKRRSPSELQVCM